MRKSVPALLSLCFLLLSATALADVRSDRHQPDAAPVKKRLFSKESRHELTPTFAMSTNDAFYQNYYAGVSYNYHIRNWVSVGALVSASFAQPTSLTTALTKPKQSGGIFEVTPDVRKAFILSNVAVEARFAPIYGKLSFFSEAVIHYDFFIMLTGGVFFSESPPVTDPNGGLGIHPYGGVGIGQRYFLLRWLALRWEFRGLFMQETFEKRGNESRLRINMSINFGFSFFF